MSEREQYRPGCINVIFTKDANMSDADMRKFAADLGIDVGVTYCDAAFGMRISVPLATEDDYVARCRKDPRVESVGRVPASYKL